MFKPNKKNVFLSFGLFIVLLVFNHFFYLHVPYEHYLYPFNLKHYLIKLVFVRIVDFLIIYILSCFLLNIRKIFNKNNVKHKLFLESFILSSLFLSIGLIKLYPGIWENDALHILEYSSTLTTVPWHNIYTSLFYILSLSFIPHPIGVIIFQLLIFNIVICYIYSNLFSIYYTKSRILIFLFLLTPINQFYTNWAFRTTISAFLELFVIFYTIFNISNKKLNKNIFYYFYLILTVFVAFYRSENVFYLFLPFLLNFNNFRNIKKTFIMIVLLAIAINCPQKIISNRYYKSDYLIVNTYGTMQYILNSLPNNDKNVLKIKNDIEKMIPLDYLKNYGQHAYFEHNYETNNYGTVSNTKGQKEYLKSVFYLYLKNYKLFIKFKLNGFTSLLLNKTYFPTYPSYSLRNEYFFKDQYNSILEYTKTKYNIKTDPTILNTNYKLVFPILIVIFSTICSLIFRKKIFFPLLLLIFKIITIVIFSPVSSFMYFYYLYLISYFLLFYFLSKLLLKINLNFKK